MRHTVNVYGVGAIMKVSGRTVLTEKVNPVEIKTASNVRFELRGLGVPTNGLQRAEIVSRVKVVDPLLGVGLAVRP